MHCLWCDDEIIQEMNWRDFFIVSGPSMLCKECELGLNVLKGDRCKKCSRLSDKDVCSDCEAWVNMAWGHFNPPLKDDPLNFNFSVFAYNDVMQDMVAKWKYRGDYQLAFAFKNVFKESFERLFSNVPTDTVLVPIPLSQERLLERGFNQSVVLAEFLPLTMRMVLSRQHGEKQAKKSRYERMTTNNPFIINEIINKTVILVDDIYTTGTTLRHAASLLRQQGCTKVYAYTLIRG